MTTPQQITLERAKKLSEIASTITTLEVQEVEAKSQWAWIAVQLGQQFRDAKEAWKGAKGEVQSWRVWVEGDEGKKIRGHSNHSLRTVQEYMLMADVFEAATETQRAALLAGGSIRGFNEVRKELGNETGEARQSPEWLNAVHSLSNTALKWISFIAVIPDESADKAEADVREIVEAGRKRWPGRFNF